MCNIRRPVISAISTVDQDTVMKATLMTVVFKVKCLSYTVSGMKYKQLGKICRPLFWTDIKKRWVRMGWHSEFSIMFLCAQCMTFRFTFIIMWMRYIIIRKIKPSPNIDSTVYHWMIYGISFFHSSISKEFSILDNWKNSSSTQNDKVPVGQLSIWLLMYLQPCIEAAAHSVYYHVDLDTNFEDRTGFICGVAKYNEEATVHAELVCCWHIMIVIAMGFMWFHNPLGQHPEFLRPCFFVPDATFILQFPSTLRPRILKILAQAKLDIRRHSLSDRVTLARIPKLVSTIVKSRSRERPYTKQAGIEGQDGLAPIQNWVSICLHFYDRYIAMAWI